jgi:hypothetical protein
MGFYGLLHSWLNAWAEFTRFADRQVLHHAQRLTNNNNNNNTN